MAPSTRRSPTLQDAAKLLQLSELISKSAHDIIQEWSKEPVSENGNLSEPLPSSSLYESQRILLSAAGMLTEIISDPNVRLLEVSSQYFESRALFLVAEKRIPDILARSGREGVSIQKLAAEVGIESLKLGRLMRTLCSIHIFEEISQDVYINNSISAALVGNDPLRAYILLFGLDLYSASDHLPKTLCHPEKGPSYDVAVTPWQDALGISKPRWEWLGEKVTIEELNSQAPGYPGYPSQIAGEKQDLVARPELGIFGLAMTGGGEVFGTAHVYDYPWASLGKAIVVDVGGGVGGFCTQLSSIYPELEFVIQDREEFLKQGREDVWPKKAPEALASGRVTFMPHDFFQPNPVQGANVYWLRYILHDWSDEYCVKILSAIKLSMTASSRILICDQVMNTTLGCADIPRAPQPLPANYSYATRYSHQRDLAMMSIINGIERTPDQFVDIINRAGLKLHRFWECRSQVSLVEICLPC